eukprot:gene11281-18913_t
MLNMSNLFPQPYKQLHATNTKNLITRQSRLCCRSGTTVMMATSTKLQVPVSLSVSVRSEEESSYCVVEVPVSLSMSVRSEEESSYCVVEVLKSSVKKGLDERRLKVEIDLSGRIVAVSSVSTPSKLFGISPTQLLFTNIASYIDKLEGMDGDPDQLTATMLSLRSLVLERGSSVYIRANMRVSTTCAPIATDHNPLAGGSSFHVSEFDNLITDRPSGLPRAARNIAGPSSLKSLSHSPAHSTNQLLMLSKKVHPVVLEWNLTESNRFGECLELSIWHQSKLSSVLEISRDGQICGVGTDDLHPAGPMFGISPSAMIHQHIRSFVSLDPPKGETLSEYLLRLPTPAKGHTPKVSALKAGSTTKKLAEAGRLLQVAGTHMDGEPLQLVVQGFQKLGSNKRMYLRVMFASRDTEKASDRHGLSANNVWQAALEQIMRPVGAWSTLGSFSHIPHPPAGKEGPSDVGLAGPPSTSLQGPPSLQTSLGTETPLSSAAERNSSARSNSSAGMLSRVTSSRNEDEVLKSWSLTRFASPTQGVLEVQRMMRGNSQGNVISQGGPCSSSTPYLRTVPLPRSRSPTFLMAADPKGSSPALRRTSGVMAVSARQSVGSLTIFSPARCYSTDSATSASTSQLLPASPQLQGGAVQLPAELQGATTATPTSARDSPPMNLRPLPSKSTAIFAIPTATSTSIPTAISISQSSTISSIPTAIPTCQARPSKTSPLTHLTNQVKPTAIPGSQSTTISIPQPSWGQVTQPTSHGRGQVTRAR